MPSHPNIPSRNPTKVSYPHFHRVHHSILSNQHHQTRQLLSKFSVYFSFVSFNTRKQKISFNSWFQFDGRDSRLFTVNILHGLDVRSASLSCGCNCNFDSQWKVEMALHSYCDDPQRHQVSFYRRDFEL